MSLLIIPHYLSPYTTSSYPPPLHFAPHPPLTSFPFFREEVVLGGEFPKEAILLRFTLVFP